MMIGPKPRNEWRQFRTKQELIAALGERYREQFPTTRFNFTQPIIDSVTEDTNGTSANLAVEFTGPDSQVLFTLARRTVELLKGIRGSTDVSIEQEGPQPQLIIQADRALCARYNVRIEDVMKLVNMAIGGDPVSTLYEGDRRFDIVARLDKQSRKSPEAIGRLPVYTDDGVPIPLAQVATIEVRERPDSDRPCERSPVHDGPLRHRGAGPRRLCSRKHKRVSAARSRFPPVIASSGWGCSRTSNVLTSISWS